MTAELRALLAAYANRFGRGGKSYDILCDAIGPGLDHAPYMAALVDNVVMLAI